MILTDKAIEYTIKCIAGIAFPQKSCRVTLDGNPRLIVDSEIIVNFMPINDSYAELLCYGNASYTTIKSFDDKVFVKVFSLPENEQPFSVCGKEVSVNFDMLTISFLMLSRYEEALVENRDKYGRFCYIDSLCSKYDLVEVPVIDEYAMLLRKFVSDNFSNVLINRREHKFIPTHDIDFLFRFPNFGKAIKTIAGDLLVRKSFRLSWKSLCAYVKSSRKVEYDPYVSGMLNLLKVSVENNLDSKFYFKALSRGSDCSYNIFSDKTKRCIERVISAGKSVGLHGGLDSYSSAEVFAKEKNNLQSVTNCEINSSRQHFLRFDVHSTPQVWQKSGIRHDSTLGFPEHEGFRCGTCHPYRLYDIDNDCVTDVVEHPLVAMDTTLFQYRNLTEEEAFASLCHLYERCVAVEGDFVLLWHNTTMFGELENWYKNVYMRFVYRVICNKS